MLLLLVVGVEGVDDPALCCWLFRAADIFGKKVIMNTISYSAVLSKWHNFTKMRFAESLRSFDIGKSSVNHYLYVRIICFLVQGLKIFHFQSIYAGFITFLLLDFVSSNFDRTALHLSSNFLSLKFFLTCFKRKLF